MRMPAADRASLLVIQPGALGDTLLSREALRALRAGFPAHELVLVTQRDIGQLLRACGDIDTIVPIEGAGLAELLAGQQPSSPTLRHVLARCSLAVCWIADPGGCLRAALARTGCSRIRIQAMTSGAFQAAHPPTQEAPGVKPWRNAETLAGGEAKEGRLRGVPPRGCGEHSCQAVGLHQADRYLETVAGLVPAAVAPAKLCVPHSMIEAGRLRLHRAGWSGREPLVVVHAGSGSPHKCADPGLLAALLAAWQGREASPVLLAGPADAAYFSAVLRSCRVPPMIVEEEDLQTVAGLLTHAALYVGYDSGVTHLAAALGLSVIGLFGPTDPARWAPRHAGVRVLTAAPCGCSNWHQVQSCREKPCLQIPLDRLLEACEGPWRGLGNSLRVEGQHSCEPL